MEISFVFLMAFSVMAHGGDVTYPSQAELNATKNNIVIGGLLPLNVPFSRRLQAAAHTAIDEINSRNDVLGDYNLVLHMKNTSAPGAPMMGPDAERQVTLKALEITNGNPMVHMVYGSLLQSNTEKSAYLTGLWNILQVSPLANSLLLSDKTRYPYYVNILVNNVFLNDLITYVFNKNNWNKAIIIGDIDFDDLGKHLEDKLKRNSVTVSNFYIVEDIDDPSDIVAEIKESGVRIVVLHVYPKMLYKIFCEVYKQNMYAPRYVWIQNRIQTVDVKDYYNQYSDASCTWDQIERSVEGMFGTHAVSYLEQFPDTVTIGGKDVKSVAGIGDVKGDDHRLYGYDSIWTMALTLNNTIQRIAPNTLDEFTYKHKNYTDIFLKELKKLSFVGATGPVAFSEKGARLQNLTFRQVRSGMSELIGVYDRSTQVFDFINRTPEYMWEPYGMTTPTSGPRVEYTYLQVSKALFGIFVAISIVGIIICLVDLTLMWTYRTNSDITYGWPIVRVVVCTGCITLNVAVILMGVDRSTADTNIHQNACQAASWLFIFGCTLFLGGMFVNSFATYHFYKEKGFEKTVRQELLYCLILVPCLLLDIILLILWQTIDPPTIRTEHLQKEYDVSRNVFYQTSVSACDCGKMVVWRIVLIVYKAVMLLIAAFITWPAWLVAHGKGSAADFHLGVCVYVTVLSAIVGISITFNVAPHPSGQYGVAGAFILLCTISTGIAILLSILSAKRNPQRTDTSALVSPVDRFLNEISESNIKRKTVEATQVGTEA